MDLLFDGFPQVGLGAIDNEIEIRIRDVKYEYGDDMMVVCSYIHGSVFSESC